MKITVFGGAKPKPGETLYEDALRLGNLLGQAGHTVLTGGYCGVMEAASRGAAEAQGHVIGVTCVEIEAFRASSANAWVKEEWRTPTLQERLTKLIYGCDAAIAMPGGVGTLTEAMLMWNLLLVGALPPRPLVLVGSGWRSVIENFYTQQSDYIRPNDHQWVSFAANIEEAAQLFR